MANKKQFNFLNGPIISDEISDDDYNNILKQYYTCIQNVIDLPDWDKLIKCDLNDFYTSKQESGNFKNVPVISYSWVLGELRISIIFNEKINNTIFITENKKRRIIGVSANSDENIEVCEKIIEKIYELSPELANYFYMCNIPITSIYPTYSN